MLILNAILCFISVPRMLAVNITAVKYEFGGPPPSLTGPLKQNVELTKAERFKVNEIVGPESFAFYKGHIYTGLADGRVVDISGPRVRTVANMGPPDCVGVQECGRPLGVTMDNDGRLVVADAPNGIVRINVDTGEKELIVSAKNILNSTQGKFFDHPAVAKDGTVYFTLSTTRWNLEEYIYIALEGETSGRLMAYNEKLNTTTVVLDNLAFANGIALGPKDEYILIAESTRARIRKLILKPGKSWMKLSTFADNVPGLPDNIRATERGTFWVGMFTARHQNMSNLFDELASQPERSEMLARTFTVSEIDDMLQKYGMVVEFNAYGDIIRTLQDPTGKHVFNITEAQEHDGCLYMGNFHQPYASRLPLTKPCPAQLRYGYDPEN